MKDADRAVTVLVFGASVFLSMGVSTFLAWFIYQEGVVNVTTLLACALAITYAMLLARFYLQRQTSCSFLPRGAASAVLPASSMCPTTPCAPPRPREKSGEFAF